MTCLMVLIRVQQVERTVTISTGILDGMIRR
jgi:hypothetical protein